MARKSNKNEEEGKKIGARKIAEYKIQTVDSLASKMEGARTVLIASTKNLPSSQYHDIKKKLRGKADIRVAKKSLVLRAIEKTSKGALQNLKEQIQADVAIFFSDLDPFELSGLLTDNQSPAKAKPGEIAKEEIRVEPGPTSLVPGPAISELSAVGLKVAVESGKLAIKQGATLARAGEAIKENVASVLAKLEIFPMKVGFEPIAAYDSQAGKVYVGIKIDKVATLETLKASISKALGFAVNLKYITKETVSYFIAKAGIEEKALSKIVEGKNSQQNNQEAK